MYYSSELLILRRNGKLARCWLAATLSDKMFMKICKPVIIKKIDVFLTCEEILSTVELRSGRSYGRFSLYLSSQLMYGITKILFYQTKFFQDDLLQETQKLFDVNRRKEEFHAIASLNLSEVPPINEVFLNLQTPSSLHLIREEPYTSTIKHLMQDEMNFGILTHEMEKLMLFEAVQPSLSEVRRFQWEESVQAPLVDINNFEIDAIEITNETLSASAARNGTEFLITVEDQLRKKSAPATPTKRALRSPTETPTKKRKISSGEELIPVAQSPFQLPASEVQQQQLFEEQQQSAVTLGHVELIEVASQKRRKRKLFDTRTKLTDSLMQKYISNAAIHTIEQRSFTARSVLPSANEYLMQPSTNILEKIWGKTLSKFFGECLNKPLMIHDEFSNVRDFEIEETITGETIRADNSSKLRDQISELSSKIVTTRIDTTELSKTLKRVFPTVLENIQAKGSKEQEKESEEFLIELPEITGFEENTRLEILEKSSDKRRAKETLKSSSSSCTKTCLTKRELLALMEIHWTEQRLIKFDDLISPENYNRIDVVCAFEYCLELHAEKIITLKQSEPFDTIWIEKYVSESDADTVAS